MKLRPTIVGVLLGIVVVCGYFAWRDWKEKQYQTYVVFENFAGAGTVPIHGKVLESRAGFIRVELENGRILEHSGQYSIVRK